MKLVLQRSQKEKGAFAKSIQFALKAQVELTEEELQNVTKYQVRDTVLFSNIDELPDSVWKAVVKTATSTVITVDGLISGCTYTAKDISELLLLEESIKQGCENFKVLLDTMASYEEDEIIEYA